MDSILDSIKKLLGIDPAYSAFDTDVILAINSALMVANQLGVGPAEGYSITSNTEKWTDFLGTVKYLEAVKTYVYLKTRLVFDPPTAAFVLDSMRSQITELEWRIRTMVESAVVV